MLSHHLKQYNDALASYDKAIAINPGNADAYWNKSVLKLLLGEYEEGWKLYEWRWKKWGTRNLSKPLWLGKEPLAGKTILIHAEQGHGDTIQFCRYVPMVEALGANVIVEVPASLMGLISTLKARIHLVTEGETLPDHDYHIPLMSLPLAFGTTRDTIPNNPYLEAQPDFVEKWQSILNEKLGESFRIGLCWAGGQRAHDPELVRLDSRRSFHFKQLKPLLDIKNASFVSLQLGQPQNEIDDERVHDISSRLKNWSDTAAVISLLDLVISVDTSVCHLAAAMGKKTYLLNRYDTCWRWLIDSDDSPWYPSLTQFRQQTPGDWDSVIEKLKEALLQHPL